MLRTPHGMLQDDGSYLFAHSDLSRRLSLSSALLVFLMWARSFCMNQSSQSSTFNPRANSGRCVSWPVTFSVNFSRILSPKYSMDV